MSRQVSFLSAMPTSVEGGDVLREDEHPQVKSLRADAMELPIRLVRDSTHGPQAGWHPGLFQIKLKGQPRDNDVQIAQIGQMGAPYG